jgi:hypothetical protein
MPNAYISLPVNHLFADSSGLRRSKNNKNYFTVGRLSTANVAGGLNIFIYPTIVM